MMNRKRNRRRGSSYFLPFYLFKAEIVHKEPRVSSNEFTVEQYCDIENEQIMNNLGSPKVSSEEPS